MWPWQKETTVLAKMRICGNKMESSRARQRVPRKAGDMNVRRVRTIFASIATSSAMTSCTIAQAVRVKLNYLERKLQVRLRMSRTMERAEREEKQSLSQNSKSDCF